MGKRRYLFRYYKSDPKKAGSENVKPKIFFIPLDTEAKGQEQERLRVEAIIDSGKVIYLVVQYETWYRKRWLPVVRYDNAHRFFHQDIMDFSGSQIEKIVIEVPDLNAALTYSINDLKLNWGKYKARFLKTKPKGND